MDKHSVKQASFCLPIAMQVQCIIHVCTCSMCTFISFLFPSAEFDQHSLECNKRCQCPDKAFNPICGSDGTEYISPCYAGCEVVNLDKLKNSILVSKVCSSPL